MDGHLIINQTNPTLLPEFRKDTVDNGNVGIFTTEMGNTVHGLDFEHAPLQLDNGDIEYSFTKIVDCDDV